MRAEPWLPARWSLPRHPPSVSGNSHSRLARFGALSRESTIQPLQPCRRRPHIPPITVPIDNSKPVHDSMPAVEPSHACTICPTTAPESPLARHPPPSRRLRPFEEMLSACASAHGVRMREIIGRVEADHKQYVYQRVGTSSIPISHYGRGWKLPPLRVTTHDSGGGWPMAEGDAMMQ